MNIPDFVRAPLQETILSPVESHGHVTGKINNVPYFNVYYITFLLDYIHIPHHYNQHIIVMCFHISLI